MTPTKLIITNIGKLAGETVIEINKPLILFYGDIKQGKTTILNCVRWVCGGEFPSDIITHGADSASIELHFKDAMIARTFYRSETETKEVRARPLTFIRKGKAVPSPVSEIKRLLNPFLLDQDFLRNKNELERKRYFIDLFDVDTQELDSELLDNRSEATKLRAKIDGYGSIDLTPVERVDISALRMEMKSVTDAHAQICEQVNLDNRQAEEQNRNADKLAQHADMLRQTIENFQRQIEKLQAELDGITVPPKVHVQPLPPAPDVSKLQSQIEAGIAANMRADQFEENKKRAEAKTADSERLAKLESRAREIKTAKQKKLKEISANCKIAGLEFDADGNFIYEGTAASMISDSQIMRLSSELSSLYPEGFGLDLIDRAESLGKSVFGFIERAQRENKSILATIVGEKPATVPENVGVFVVENGKVKE